MDHFISLRAFQNATPEKLAEWFTGGLQNWFNAKNDHDRKFAFPLLILSGEYIEHEGPRHLTSALFESGSEKARLAIETKSADMIGEPFSVTSAPYKIFLLELITHIHMCDSQHGVVNSIRKDQLLQSINRLIDHCQQEKPALSDNDKKELSNALLFGLSVLPANESLLQKIYKANLLSPENTIWIAVKWWREDPALALKQLGSLCSTELFSRNPDPDLSDYFAIAFANGLDAKDAIKSTERAVRLAWSGSSIESTALKAALLKKRITVIEETPNAVIVSDSLYPKVGVITVALT